MKSIEEHFIDSMPADIAAMAIRNTPDDLLDLKICKTPADALMEGFNWVDSREGYAFWKSVFSTVSKEGDFRDMESASEKKVIKNDLINEIIDIWFDNKGIALGRLWMLDEMICELEKDKARLDWLLSTQSGYSINGLGTREQIDKAIEDEWFEREQLEQDRKRLDWLLRDTTFLTGISSREKIDEAMDEEWCERERRDKILSGMDAEDYE